MTGICLPGVLLYLLDFFPDFINYSLALYPHYGRKAYIFPPLARVQEQKVLEHPLQRDVLVLLDQHRVLLLLGLLSLLAAARGGGRSGVHHGVLGFK
jgi:hypothetical protein